MTIEQITNSAGRTNFNTTYVITAAGTVQSDASNVVFNSTSNMLVRMFEPAQYGQSVLLQNVSTGSVVLSLPSGNSFDNSLTTIRLAQRERAIVTAVGSQQWTTAWLPTPGSEVITTQNASIASLSGHIIIVGASNALAGTLAKPTTGDDGKSIRVSSGSAHAHQLAATDTLLSGYTTFNFGTLIGASNTWTAYNGTWWGADRIIAGTYTL